MWIIARLLFSLLFALIRAIRSRHLKAEGSLGSGGGAWVHRRHRNKRRVVATSFGVPCENPVFLQLSPERRTHRLFKYLGFARELQTGDAGFDLEVYVACDHPALAPLLESEAALRDCVRALFRSGVTRIHTDGRHLWARQPGDRLPDERSLAALRALRDALALVPGTDSGILHDPFVRRALLAETVAWSLALYGLSGLVVHLSRPLPLYFDYFPLITAGSVVGVVYVFLFLLGLKLLLGRSSRSPRVFFECAILLLPGLLWLGIENTSQANIYLDRSPAVELRPLVTGRHTTTHRRRRGRTSTSYHLRLDAGPDARAAALLSPTLAVPPSLYQQASIGKPLLIRVREGAFGYEWAESIVAAP